VSKARAADCGKACSQTETKSTGLHAGTDVAILSNIRRIILAFFAQTSAEFCKNLIVTLVFEKKSQFFPSKIGKQR
jgi:hypothetical protein